MAKCEGGVELSSPWRFTSDVGRSQANIIAPDGAPAIATRRLHGYQKFVPDAQCALQQSLEQMEQPTQGLRSWEVFCPKCHYKSECIKYPSTDPLE